MTSFSASRHTATTIFCSPEISKIARPIQKGTARLSGPLMHNRDYKEFGEGYLTEIFTDATIDFLESHQEEPFFVTLSYNSVHHLIHQVPKRYLDKHGVREIPNYDPETMGGYEDWFKRYITLGEINAEEFRRYYLANLNCLDDNIGSPSGHVGSAIACRQHHRDPVFRQRRRTEPPVPATCRLPGASLRSGRAGIRVPFILARPNESAPGTICDRTISTLDILPTCLQKAGIELPEGLDGQPIPKRCHKNRRPARPLLALGR